MNERAPAVMFTNWIPGDAGGQAVDSARGWIAQKRWSAGVWHRSADDFPTVFDRNEFGEIVTPTIFLTLAPSELNPSQTRGRMLGGRQGGHVGEERFRNPIRIPGLEARVAIVQERAEQKKVTLPKDVALYLAQNVRSNAAALEGAVALLIAHSSLIGTDITLNYAKTILKNFIDPHAHTATVDPFRQMSLGQDAANEANRTRQAPAAADPSTIFYLLETLEGRKIRRVREVLEVNIREREREQLAGRDGYERALERRAKKRKRG